MIEKLKEYVEFRIKGYNDLINNICEIRGCYHPAVRDISIRLGGYLDVLEKIKELQEESNA